MTVVIHSGTLRHHVRVWKRVEADATDGTIDRSEVEETVTPWHVAIMPLSGRELFDAQQAKSVATHRIVGRYFAGLTTNHFVMFGSRRFEIEQVMDIEERHVRHELLCKEIV